MRLFTLQSGSSSSRDVNVPVGLRACLELELACSERGLTRFVYRPAEARPVSSGNATAVTAVDVGSRD